MSLKNGRANMIATRTYMPKIAVLAGPRDTPANQHISKTMYNGYLAIPE